MNIIDTIELSGVVYTLSAQSSGGSCCITEEQVDEKIASAKTEIEGEMPSLDGYATEQWVLDKHYISGVDLSNYALKSEIPTKVSAFQNDVPYLTEHQSLSGYVTGEDMSAYTYDKATIDSKISSGGTFDPTNYYNKTEVNNIVNSAVTSAVTIVDGEGYATEQWVKNQNYISGVDLSNYATLQDIPDVPTKVSAFENDVPYLTEHQSLSGYATEQWVSGFTYDKDTIDRKISSGGTFDPTLYYTKNETNSAITSAMTVVESYIPSLEGYATEQWVLDKNYITGVDLSNYATNSGLSSYTYSKTETNNLLDNKLDASAYTPTDLSQYWTSAQTSSAITQAVTGKANSSDVITNLTIDYDDIAASDNAFYYQYTKGGNDEGGEIFIPRSGLTVNVEQVGQADHTYLDVNTTTAITNGSTAIPTSDAVYRYVRAISSGATYDAGRGINITNTTISLDLPIYSGTNETNIIIGDSGNTVNDDYSVAEGMGTSALSEATHAEGYFTKVSSGAQHSHAEGHYTVVDGIDSHAEGVFTNASGYGCHAEGGRTVASGEYSHTEGSGTTAINEYEHANGIYNVSRYDSMVSGSTLFTIGNGTDENNRHNAFEVRRNGDIFIQSGNTDVKLQTVLGSIPSVTSAATSGSTAVMTSGGVYEQLGGLKLVKISQNDYNNLQNKDNNTLYIIV